MHKQLWAMYLFALPIDTLHMYHNACCEIDISYKTAAVSATLSCLLTPLNHSADFINISYL
jgi:hypothetical protein